MSKNRLNLSSRSQGATDADSGRWSTPNIHTPAAKAAPVNRTMAAPSASPPSRDENASASMSSRAPIPTTSRGERARARFMAAQLPPGAAGSGATALGASGRRGSSFIGPS